MEEKLVSIIMPAYNETDYIAEAIQSALDQTYQNFELLIVDNGSTDNTEGVIKSFEDKRINYFKIQTNVGVGAARNTALDKMQGDYFIFLDADDKLPPDSIRPRVDILNSNPEIYFVGGTVILMDRFLRKQISVHKTEIHGNPFLKLVTLSPQAHTSSSWLRRRDKNINYRFRENMPAFEDLLFSVNYSKTGLLTNIDALVLFYRRGHGQTTSSKKAFEDGYSIFYEEIKERDDIGRKIKFLVKYKIIRIMIMSYLKLFRPMSAIKVFFRYLFI
ncbi:MAG: glycosyltransferase family 2 protein [Bacteroidales bacterium]|nr:glycosyltransferase family 2 protein [Bacteroidales bacterium]